MSSLEKRAGSLDGWLERSSNGARDSWRDLRNAGFSDDDVALEGEERCRIRGGGGRGTSLSIVTQAFVLLPVPRLFARSVNRGGGGRLDTPEFL